MLGRIRRVPDPDDEQSIQGVGSLLGGDVRSLLDDESVVLPDDFDDMSSINTNTLADQQDAFRVVSHNPDHDPDDSTMMGGVEDQFPPYYEQQDEDESQDRAAAGGCLPLWLTEAPSWLKTAIVVSTALLVGAIVLVGVAAYLNVSQNENGNGDPSLAVGDELVVTSAPVITPAFPSVSPAPSAGPSTFPSASPSMTPSASPRPSLPGATKQPSIAPTTKFPTVAPSPTPSSIPTTAPSPTPSSIPTTAPSPTPSSAPTAAPSPTPSSAPTAAPSLMLSSVPTEAPSLMLSSVPTVVPSLTPSSVPTAVPSLTLSSVPTDATSLTLSSVPTDATSQMTSSVPVTVPSQTPSSGSTGAPSLTLSSVPTGAPSPMATSFPIIAPTVTSFPIIAPTEPETSEPTTTPTAEPTVEPTATPTAEPTAEPTEREGVVISGSKTVFYLTAGRPEGDDLSDFEDNLPNLPKDADFMVHLGDWNSPFSTECDEDSYRVVDELFRTSSVPVYFIPGDNEYNDCPNADQAFGFWKETLIGYETKYWPSPPWAIERYSGVHPENFAFVVRSILYIGINLVGGVIHDEDEWPARHAANLVWIDSQFAKHRQDIEVMIVFAHADPDLERNDPFFLPFFDRIRTIYYMPTILIHRNLGIETSSSEENFDGIPNFAVLVAEGTFWPPMRVEMDTTATGAWSLVWDQGDWFDDL